MDIHLGALVPSEKLQSFRKHSEAFRHHGELSEVFESLWSFLEPLDIFAGLRNPKPDPGVLFHSETFESFWKLWKLLKLLEPVGNFGNFGIFGNFGSFGNFWKLFETLETLEPLETLETFGIFACLYVATPKIFLTFWGVRGTRLGRLGEPGRGGFLGEPGRSGNAVQVTNALETVRTPLGKA